MKTASVHRVLCSWLQTPVFGVRNSILNRVSKTQSVKREKKRKKVFKAAQSFFKLAITFLKYISCFTICENIVLIPSQICDVIESVRLTKWHQYICSISLKFGACYIMGQWGEFRIKNATICLHILFWYSFSVVFYYEICVFIISISFFW